MMQRKYERDDEQATMINNFSTLKMFDDLEY